MKSYEEQPIKIKDNENMCMLLNARRDLRIIDVLKTGCIEQTKERLIAAIFKKLHAAGYMHPNYAIVYQWCEGELAQLPNDIVPLAYMHYTDPTSIQPIEYMYRLELRAYILTRNNM